MAGVRGVFRRESTGTSTSDWDDDNMLATVVASTSSSRPLVTSLSTDNLQQELARATCTSDGLSDKENIVQQMKHHVKYLPDSLSTVRVNALIKSIPSHGAHRCQPWDIGLAGLIGECLMSNYWHFAEPTTEPHFQYLRELYSYCWLAVIYLRPLVWEISSPEIRQPPLLKAYFQRRRETWCASDSLATYGAI